MDDFIALKNYPLEVLFCLGVSPLGTFCFRGGTSICEERRCVWSTL